MATTIQISDTTKQLLDTLKKEEHKTFDEIIKRLLESKLNIPKSMFGADKKLPSWRKTDRMAFNER